MTDGDLVVYHGGHGDPKPALLLRFLSERKALIRLAGAERSVRIASLRALKEGTLMDYTALLLKEIGRPAVDALRALDAGGDPRAVYLAMREATLPPGPALAMREARRQPDGLTTDDLRAVLPDASPATLSNRLAELEEIGLLVKAGRENLKGGGRRFVYRPYDAA